MQTTTLDALALPETPPSALRLFRDGWNDTVKGRFLLDAEGAGEILRRFAAHGVELAMDFDHGTFTEGGPKRDVPGYIGALDYRAGDGLYATGIRWTEVGLRAIAPGRAPDGAPTVPEYRDLSPAIDFDPDTRRILGLKPVALVSWPATVGQRPLVMSAARLTALDARDDTSSQSQPRRHPPGSAWIIATGESAPIPCAMRFRYTRGRAERNPGPVDG